MNEETTTFDNTNDRVDVDSPDEMWRIPDLGDKILRMVRSRVEGLKAARERGKLNRERNRGFIEAEQVLVSQGHTQRAAARIIANRKEMAFETVRTVLKNATK